MREDLHPYVVFLPSEEKTRTLAAIFGSKVAVDILKFSLAQGISRKIYQKELVRKLKYSNKTIIENLKTLTRLSVLTESMEKSKEKNRTVWVKTYQLSDVGRWFALLLAEEKELSKKEKTEILHNLFQAYIKWAIGLAENLHMDKKILLESFLKEIKAGDAEK